jgi:hypothetical protein
VIDSGNDGFSMNSRVDSFGIFACLGIALALRLAVIATQPQQLTLDRDLYLVIAANVADGRGYSSDQPDPGGPSVGTPTAYRPPLYPLLLALGLHWFPMATVVAGLNVAAGLLTVWLTADLGNRLQFGGYRFLAALLVSVDPLLVQYTAQPMTETLATALATGWLWSVVASPLTVHSGSSVKGLFRGILFGLLVLCRPTFWPVAGVYALGWLVANRGRREGDSNVGRVHVLARSAGSVCGIAIVVAPWLIRNWFIFGVPILTTTHGGYTLLLGNNPTFDNQVVEQPWGTVWQLDSLQQWQSDIDRQIENALGPQATEVERDAWQSRQAKRFIAADPARCAKAAIHRIRSLWNTSPQGDAKTGISEGTRAAVGWYYAVILTLAFAGLVRVAFRPMFGSWMPVYALLVSVQIVHLFYWTNTRMRAPLTPALALLAAAAVIPRRRPIPITAVDIQPPASNP